MELFTFTLKNHIGMYLWGTVECSENTVHTMQIREIQLTVTFITFSSFVTLEYLKVTLSEIKTITFSY